MRIEDDDDDDDVGLSGRGVKKRIFLRNNLDAFLRFVAAVELCSSPFRRGDLWHSRGGAGRTAYVILLGFLFWCAPAAIRFS